MVVLVLFKDVFFVEVAPKQKLGEDEFHVDDICFFCKLGVDYLDVPGS